MDINFTKFFTAKEELVNLLNVNNNLTPYEQWKQIENIGQNKPEWVSSAKRTMWTFQKPIERRDLWSHMNSAEQKDWYSLQPTKLSKWQFLIDVANDNETAKKIAGLAYLSDDEYDDLLLDSLEETMQKLAPHIFTPLRL